MTAYDDSADDPKSTAVALPVEAIQQQIIVLRDHRVLLDADLAVLYGVETKVLVQAVKRNIDRFPEDFMFQLDSGEWEALRSQSVTSKTEASSGRGGRRTAPYAFTEQGVAMLSGVLRSERAIAVNIAIMRAFVQLRRVLASHVELGHRLDELERRVTEHDAKHDAQVAQIIEAIRQLMQPPPPKRRPVGFAPPDDASS